MRLATLVIVAAATLLAQAGEGTLAITEAGVQRSEDSPFVSVSYKFLPGEFIYFTFQIAGFKATEATDVQNRKVSLSYQIIAEDSGGVQLAQPETGKIEEELTAEDKNWTPKRRASFQLPSYVASGSYRIRVIVHDEIGKTEEAREFPFRIGGPSLAPASTVGIQSFEFFRSENDREPLELAAFQTGDPIYARFRMVGFQKGEGNSYHLSYRVTVLQPDGKPYLRDLPDAEAEGKSFYPAPYVPGDIALTTSKGSGKGQYILIVVVRDLVSNTQGEYKTSFTLE